MPAFIDIIFGFILILIGFYLSKSVDSSSDKIYNRPDYMIVILISLSGIGRLLAALELSQFKYFLSGFQIIVAFYILKALIIKTHYSRNQYHYNTIYCEEVVEAIKVTRLRSREEIHRGIMQERSSVI